MNCLAWRGRARARLLALASLLLCAFPCRALADQDACLAAHEQAQVERMKGRFLEAREQLLACAQAGCPGVVRGDCKSWLEEVESSLPSVVFAVADEQGRDLIEARVSSEAGLLSDRADGRALAMNPGVYKVRIEAAGYLPAEQQVSVREGEKRRLVRVVLRATAATEAEPRAARVQSAARMEASEPAPGERRARRLLLSGYVLGGVALATLAAGGAVGIVGHGELEELRRCKPECDKGEVAAGRRKYVAANVAFGVGGALLAAAAVSWALGYRKQRETRTLPTLAADARGVSLSWGGRF